MHLLTGLGGKAPLASRLFVGEEGSAETVGVGEGDGADSLLKLWVSSRVCCIVDSSEAELSIDFSLNDATLSADG